MSGNVELAGDSAIEFASGEITSLAANAQLRLNGSDAFIEDSKAPGSNSALMGLASIGAGAIFELENGASVSTTGALINDGNVNIAAGSSLTLAGALTNSGYLDIDNSALSSPSKVSATALTNTGSLFLSDGASLTTGALVNDGQIYLDHGQSGGSNLTVAGTLTNSGLLNFSAFNRPSEISAKALTNTGTIYFRNLYQGQGLLDVTDSAGFGAAGSLERPC